MTEEQLITIFKYLKDNFNYNNKLYFKLIDNNQIGAYFIHNNKHIAGFYISVIVQEIDFAK